MKKVPIPQESVITLSRNIFKVGLVEHTVELFKKYGDIVNPKVPPSAIWFSHPDYAKHIYHDNAPNYFKKPAIQVKLSREWLGDGLEATNNYEIWKKNRAIDEPFFYNANFKNYAQQIVHNSLNMLEGFATAAATRTPINLNLHFAELAINNLITTIFKNIDFDFKEFSAYIHEMLILLVDRSFALTDLPWHLPTKAKRKWDQAIKIMDEVVVDVIQKRVKQGELGDDLLGKLLKVYLNEPDQNKAMKQVRDEVMILLFAGHDTIANTLTWCVSLLSLHPEVERRVRDEIASVVNGREPTYEDIKSLHYTQAVLSETMRLCPVVSIIGREAIEDDEINGYPIPKGTNCQIAIYNIHHHPDFWPNPQAFDPERFIKNPWSQHHRYAFIPGTAGERHCIGIHYALMEGCLALVTMLQQYRLTLPFGATLRPQKFSFFLEPETVMMMVEKV